MSRQLLCDEVREKSRVDYIICKNMMDEYDDHFYNRKRFLAMTNMTAGIYNKNKALFDKGQRQFQKYSLEYLEQEVKQSQTEDVGGYIIDPTTGKVEQYDNENWILNLSNSMKEAHENNITEPNRTLDEIGYWN